MTLRMESTVHYYHRRRHLTSPLTNQRRPNTNDAQSRVVFAMRLRNSDLFPLKRVSANLTTTIVNKSRFPDSRLFRLNGAVRRMATKNDQESVRVKEDLDMAKKNEQKEKEEEEPKKSPQPPPPEKPEPGDCCGSGCVRCVWDVYYDELEAYITSFTRPDTNGIKFNCRDRSLEDF